MSSSNDEKDPKKTICRELWGYPVIELTRPRIRTCCRRGGEVIDEKTLSELGTDVFLNLPATVEDRVALMKGEKIDACKVCWNMEDEGLRSWRLGAPDWQYHFNKRGALQTKEEFRSFDNLITQHDNPAITKSTEPYKLDISLGTFCDLKCLYCNSDYSTSWESETKKFGAMFEDPSRSTPFTAPGINSLTIPGYFEKFLEWFDEIYMHLDRIALMGGEPTYSPLFEKLTDHIVSRLQISARKDSGLTIVTNLNWPQRTLDYVISLRERLPPSVNLILEVSMESHGRKAEYIRNGVNWERFHYNLKKVAIIDGIEIKLLPTLNALCLTSLVEYLEMIREIEVISGKVFETIANMVTYPKWLSFDILDQKYSIYAAKAMAWITITYSQEEAQKKVKLMRMLTTIKQELNKEHSKQSVAYFYRWISEIDKRRGQNFLEVFPEMKDLYELGKAYQDDRSIIIDMEYLKL